MITIKDLIYILISIAAYVVYKVKLKETTEKVIFLFWMNLITYLGFLSIFLVKKIVLKHDIRYLNSLLFEFTFTNIPLYFLLALSFLASVLIMNYMLNNYELSSITPILQLGLLFTTLTYLSLGDPFNLNVIIGILIVCFGAIITALDSLTHPIRSLLRIPKALMLPALVESILGALSALITYLCTTKTLITDKIMDSLRNIHALPFSFFNPFHFNIGVRFFIMIIFFYFLITSPKYKINLFPFFKNNMFSILIFSLFYLISAYTYQTAYFFTKDKNILSALYKLNLPIILFTGYLFLNEKINFQKILGNIIIILGSIVTLFS